MVPQNHQQLSLSEGSPWFAVRVRSNHERVAVAHLRERGYEEFAPSYKSQSQWSDRKKTIEKFLFPGYVFSRINPDNRLPVLSIPGVVGLVSFGQGPCPIPDYEIQNVQAMVRSGLYVTPFPYLNTGQSVIMDRGPLTGMQGIIQEVKGVLRLVVSINLLQRSISVEVDRTWVRPLQDSDSRTRLTNGEWVRTRSSPHDLPPG